MDSREGRIFESAVEQIQEPHQFHRTAEIAENLAGQRVGYTPKQENTLGLAGKRFSPGAVEATEVEGISGKQVEQEEMRETCCHGARQGRGERAWQIGRAHV